MKTKNILILVTAWTVGLLIGLVVALLRLLGRVKVLGLDVRRLKRLMRDTGKGVIFVSNHPSMAETFVIPGLFFPYYLLSPKLMPVSTPDIRFYDAWWFSMIRPTCLPVVRTSAVSGGKFIISMISVLKEGRMAILFAEGGRTYKGMEFRTSGKKRIRRFKEGIDKILERAAPIVVPVWTEGGEGVIPNVDYNDGKGKLPFPRFWRRMSLRFGEPTSFTKEDFPDPVRDLESLVLGLSSR